MRIVRLHIENFRGIKHANLFLPQHGVLIGDNNTGKTTILEALDLVLGPDRLSRQSIIDEHDFFRGIYARQKKVVPDADEVATSQPPAPGGETEEISELKIIIEATIEDLSDVQKAKFGNYIEFWDSAADKFYDAPNIDGIDSPSIKEAIRVTFHGWYNEEEDDFEGATYFSRSLTENDKPDVFSKRHKQLCGFLYLRSIRTGSRALSLERGTLLDIILRLKEIRPQMWEATLSTLSAIDVASDPALGISPVLESINAALKKYVPKEWGIEPRLKVSNLTREHLRKVITAFIATDDGAHAAPYYRQGTGTINMLVLAMLSQIAESKQNVIFAMEEPETAIPPYAQKRIVHEIRALASQALFTSHSPYVLEEFETDETVVLARDASGFMEQRTILLPSNIKQKRYRQEFRTRFCEGLLARRILIAEGPTEYSAFPVVCRRLAELDPERYCSLESLGICTVDADGEKNIPGMAQLYNELGKQTFAICDRQNEVNKVLIEEQVELLLMHGERGFEDLILKGTTQMALEGFAAQLDWPQHLRQKYETPAAQAESALREYFSWSKGSLGIADFIAQCSEDEVPTWLRDAALRLKTECMPASASFGMATVVPAETSLEVDPNGDE